MTKSFNELKKQTLSWKTGPLKAIKHQSRVKETETTAYYKGAMNTVSFTVRERTEVWEVSIPYLGKFLAGHHRHCLEKQPLAVLLETVSEGWLQNQHLHD